ncbi:MAG TPA: exosortase-associated EpsI family protein [Candidatus Baltobacteraceae bacterium]|jgi:hypothetical protein|nr:exosortase-associated EpsI family protein [Candidatus Baltobacteraceae bacterium]
MKQRKWILFVVALAMIAATGGYLADVRGTQRLGAPGVRVGPVPLYSAVGAVVAPRSVLLPDTVLGAPFTPEPITDVELAGLPRDTTFGRRRYRLDEEFAPIISVVLMGTDRTSIHQPQFCLVGAGWTIDQTEHVTMPIDRPYPYDLTAIKLTTSKPVAAAHHQSTLIRGIYIYWFVSADKITADQGTRLWSIAKTMVENRELERWAYISYFVPCVPGEEEATFGRLEHFIQASVPAFQVVAGQPTGGNRPVAVLK